MLRFYSPVCELEAMYKFSTDVLSLAEHSDWAFQGFTLRQVICDICQFIGMDAQRTCIWRTVSSSVKRHFAFFSHANRERESYM